MGIVIGIIYCNEINMCPYMQKYIDSLEKNCVKYKVLLWNRTGERKQYPLHYIVYNRELDLYVPKWKKIPAFVGFSKFLYKELLNQRFDRLIMLTTLPTVISAPLLLAKYKKKYIYDFRDMSFEKCIPFRILVDKLVKHSYFTSVSSPGYMTVIKGDTIISHNFRYSDLDNGLNKMKPFKEKITLLHIGITRGEEYNKRLADIFGNDNRFEVKIIGTGNDTKPFVEYIKKFRNITVKGTYNNEEKKKYIQECDMLLYYYPCSFNNNRALANKYYDGMIFKKPLIGNKNTYSGKRIMKAGLGISVDIDNNDVPNQIYKYMHSIRVDEYEKLVQKELDKVIKEDQKYVKAIDSFVRGN